jgi:stearoyl-CoA desaturase (delta-9 desaturase)
MEAEDSIDSVKTEKPYKMEIVWRNVLIFIFLHYAAVAFFFLKVKRATVITGFIYGVAGSFGISSGAHRLWAHKAYKANQKMKVMLLFFQTIALQNSVIEWVRDHRVHHKFSDTNADPHNSGRGFFFSHMGWLLCRLNIRSSRRKSNI